MNITGRKQAELQLEESRDRLQSILDTTFVQMSILKAVRNNEGQIINFEITALNKELEKETGRTDLMVKLYATEYPGIRETDLFDLAVKAIETGEPQGTEYFYPHDGFNKWFSCVFVKLYDGVVATNMDITERKRSEEEKYTNYLLLQQSEALAALGSWEYDLATGNFIWSEGMYRLFDLQKGAEIKPEIYLEYSTETGHAVAERVVQHIRQCDSDFEERLELNISGITKIFHIKATIVNDGEGRPEKVLGTDMDISSMRAAEEKIRQMEAEQQQQIFRVIPRTQEEEEERRISESLHNGLGQMLYRIKMILSQLTVKDAIEEPKEFESTKRYTSELLTEAMHDTRRISHELMPAVLEEYGLRAAVKDICEQMQHEISFECSVMVEDGQIDKYMQLAVFRTLQEMMVNVVKHAEATKAEAIIHIEDQQILLQVTDNGKGINPDKQGKDGIGLASIRSKVDLLNGAMHIQSSPGQGTTVKIRLPYIPQK